MVLLLCGGCRFVPGVDMGSNDSFQHERSLNESSSEVIELPEESQGQHAIDLLGNRLAFVAARYGKSAAELRALLLRDRTLWVDRRGNLFYKEKVPEDTGNSRR